MQPLHSSWARPPMLPGADSCRAPSVLITPVAAALSCSLFLCMDSPSSAKDFKGNSCIDVCPPTPSLSCSLLSAALPCRDRLFRLHQTLISVTSAHWGCCALLRLQLTALQSGNCPWAESHGNHGAHTFPSL